MRFRAGIGGRCTVETRLVVVPMRIVLFPRRSARFFVACVSREFDAIRFLVLCRSRFGWGLFFGSGRRVGLIDVADIVLRGRRFRRGRSRGDGGAFDEGRLARCFRLAFKCRCRQ